MISETSIGKVIWRKPSETKIFSLSNTEEGTDEFVIAPFRKNEKIFSIKGTMAEMDQAAIHLFFTNIRLSETANTDSTSHQKYIEGVTKAVEAIADKRFDKVVLARQLFFEKTLQIEPLFLTLTKKYPSAFVYCFILENGTCMIGASPETLLEKKGIYLSTEALGGTAQANGYNEKEHLEHRQIVTYISEKLNASGYNYHHSETVAKLAGNVSHLSTPFMVDSKSVIKDMALLDILHPTSAVCGLPFLPANEFIASEEDFDRKFYAGYLGIRSGDDFSFFVNLRCADIYNNGATLYAGAGINKDSVPESEWEETTHKLDTLLAFIR